VRDCAGLLRKVCVKAPDHPPQTTYYAQTTGDSVGVLGGTVGILQTNYPSKQVSNQDKEAAPYRGRIRCYHVPHGSRPCLPTEVGSDTATCPMASDPASLPRRVLVLPRVSWLQTLPPYRGGLRHCHMPRSSKPHLPTREGSGAATCHTALDPAYLLGSALDPASPLGRLQRYHVFHDS
jgi:hypothetical protein